MSVRRNTLWFATGLALLLGLTAAGAEPRIAERKPFTVPLRDGQTGTAVLLDARQMVLASPGNPPQLAFFTIEPHDAPDPGPQPGPEPTPPPPDPIRGPLTLLWVEETEARTPAQARALTDPTIREALVAAGWTLRVVDQDVTDENGRTPPELAAAIQQARQSGLPYLIAWNAARAEVFAGKAPADKAQFLELLGRLGLKVPASEVSEVKHNEATRAGGDPQPPDPAPQKTQENCPTGVCPAPPVQPRVYLFRRR